MAAARGVEAALSAAAARADAAAAVLAAAPRVGDGCQIISVAVRFMRCATSCQSARMKKTADMPAAGDANTEAVVVL